jgi:hypothetical protein
MRLCQPNLVLCLAIAAALMAPRGLAAPYTLVEGYNVLDNANLPGLAAADFAATSGQERDIAVDAKRGIIYIARGLTSHLDGRGSVNGGRGIAAIVATNNAFPGSNYRDTGIIEPAGGWCQSLAYDPGSDQIWVLGGPLNASPTVYVAPGGTLGGAPNGGSPMSVNSAFVQAFKVDTNLLDVGVYVNATVSTNGTPSRGGAPRGFAVRTVNGTNTTVYIGMGNHVQAWSNDQPLDGTNSPWRRVWATLRPPTSTLVTTRVALTGFNGVNGIAVDDSGNCFFTVQNTGGRIWCVRPEIVESVADPFSLDYNDTAYGGGSERDILPVLITGSAGATITNTPQSLTFCRFENQKTLFASFLPSATTRAVTRLDLEDEVSFDGGPHIRGTVVDGFGSGQPAAGQDGVLATMRLRAASGTQPAGTVNNLLYTDVNSVTNPTFIYANAFVIDTNKGQTVPTSAILKIQIPENTNAISITAQPATQSLIEGGNIVLGVAVSGQRPISYQWQYNSGDIPGATTANFSVRPATTNDSGLYSVIISNIHGIVVSTQAQVTVLPLVRSGVMTLLWSNAPGSRPYLTTDTTQRGLAYSPDGNHVVVASRSPASGVYLLDAETGEDVFPLTLGPAVSGGTLAINAVGAADDGHIYVANLAQNAEPFHIYRWDFAEFEANALLAYTGTPVAGNRWGDTLAVRGSGNNIQILAGSRSSNVVALFTTTDGGQSFLPTIINVPEAPNGAFGLGLAFGEGNTFWGKGDGSTGLRQVSFDPVAGTGTVLHTFGAPGYPLSATSIAVETTRNILAAISVENPDNLRLYNLADLAGGLVLLDQELFPTDNPNTFATGAVAFGGGKVFALDSNNGIIALTLGSLLPPPGAITIERNGNIVTLTWEGAGYVLQSADVVTGPYEDIPGVSSGYTEDITSFGNRFFRLRD